MPDAKLPENVKDWEAPWEKEGADEFDADKAKGFIFAAKKRGEALEADLKASKAETEKVQARVDELEKAEQKRIRESETAEEKARREAEERKSEQSEKDAEHEKTVRENHLLKVRLETGLSEQQVKRLVGDDFDALLEDAKAYIEETGWKPEAQREEDPEEDPDNPSLVRRQPVVKGLNPADQERDRGEDYDPQKVADAIYERRNRLI